jgi:hypothetical protein
MLRSAFIAGLLFNENGESEAHFILKNVEKSGIGRTETRDVEKAIRTQDNAKFVVSPS